MKEADNDLKARINSWVIETGFPLEMRIQSFLEKTRRKLMSYSLPNSGYLDPNTGKVREGGDAVFQTNRVEQRRIDGVCYQFRTYVFGVIECKSPKKPWIAFLKPFQVPYRMVAGILSDQDGSELIQRNMSRSEIRNPLEKELSEASLLRLPSHASYSIVEFKSDPQQNKAYNATRQVTDAGIGVVEEHSKYFGDPRHKNVTLFGAYAFIVTSGEIFTCRLSDQGTPEIEEVETVVYVDERGISSRTRYVRLMTEEYFQRHFEELVGDMQKINLALEEILLQNNSLTKPA